MRVLKKTAVGFGLGLALVALAKRFWRGDEKPVSRKERLRQAYAEAASDAAYQAEMAEIDRAFDVAVGDGLANPAPTRA